MHLNKLFFCVGVMTGIFFNISIIAAPSVRNFGTATNSKTLSNTQNNKKPNLQSFDTSKRASSLRISDSTIKPTTKTTSFTKSVSAAPSRISSAGSTRASGLHSNPIKSLSSKLSSNSTSQPSGNNSSNTSDLEQRVTNLETKMSKKQDTLEFGDGINIENNTISLPQEIRNLPEAVENMNQEISDLSRQINDATLPANYWTAGETKTYLQENYYKQEYIDQGLHDANFMNYFDGDISENAVYIFKTDANGNGKFQILNVQDRWDPEF